MKKFSFLALAAAGMLLSACSEKDVAVAPVNPNEFEDGAYIGISLSLPSADNATRANDDLSNGIKEEFAVKNATLYIFKGTSEANAVYVDYVSLGTTYNPDTQGGINPDVWGVQPGVGTKPVDADDAGDDRQDIGGDDGETNITSTSLNEATKIPNNLAAEIKADATNNYYAYVIINHNAQIPELTKNSTTFQEFSRTKFDKIGADIALEQNIWDDGMLMTNAPISNVSGGVAAPSSPTYSTLVPLDKSKIFQSAAQAKQNPAACVYVERAAVKITVEEGNTLSASEIDGYSVAIDGWKVINTEEKYYNTRQINLKSTETAWDFEDWGGYINENASPANAKYRFVSFYQFVPTLPDNLADGYTHTTGFRTYFAADPHYDFDCLAADPSTSVPSTLKYTTAADSRPWIKTGKHAYTTENTFDVKHQTWRNTTMVTVKAHLDGAAAFYTVGKGGQTMYTNVADVKAVIHNLLMNDPNVSGAAQNLLNLISKNNVEKTVKQGLDITVTTPSVATTGVAISVEPAFKIGTADATYDGPADGTLEATDPLYGKTEEDLKDALETAIDNYLHPTIDGVLQETYNDPVLVSYYVNGEMFYNVKIQHFGEPETPWGGNDVVANGSGVNVNEIYFNTLHNNTPTPENITAGQNKFLGRYGVVRDNWYKLTLEKVTKIGSATPEDPSMVTPDTPDDEIENYISVHVHIVPWVLRSQSVIL